jgi:hypothetical protein
MRGNTETDDVRAARDLERASDAELAGIQDAVTQMLAEYETFTRGAPGGGRLCRLREAALRQQWCIPAGRLAWPWERLHMRCPGSP